jgi:KDO2-lipid IV(A) lauroyltransferase
MIDKELLKPKYWGIWTVLGLARVVVCLPYRALLSIAIFIGILVKPLMKRRQSITIINLKIAFPDKSEDEILKLADECYKSICMAGFESLIAWFMPERMWKKVPFDMQTQTLTDALEEGSRPVIILGFHFHCLEIAGRAMGNNYDQFTVMYQKNHNKLMEHTIKTSREKYMFKTFERKGIIAVIKSLRKKVMIWYAPDQDFREHTIFAPFFGKMCTTLTVTPWLADRTNAVVIPMYYYRKKDLSGYVVVTKEAITFSGDQYEDAKMTNELLESIILEHPEQYLWQHRRYKTRPEGEQKIY